MARKIFHHGIRISRIALETGGVVVGLVLLALILFLARIGKGPIDVGFATQYIEKGAPRSGQRLQRKRAGRRRAGMAAPAGRHAARSA